jgi:hypothetical protein
VERIKMNDIKISDMLNMQKDLYEMHKDKWTPLEAEYGRNFIHWIIEEIGECIAIINNINAQRFYESL